MQVEFLGTGGAITTPQPGCTCRICGEVRRIPEDHHLLTIEATFDQTLAVVRKLKARQVIMSHIEEIDQLSYDDLKRLEKQLQNQGLTNITFAYDTLLVDV